VRYAAFLRAVNLGSTRKAPSSALRAAFEEMGFEDVATFRNSGNVAFSAAGKSGDEGAIAAGIESGLARALGFEVPVFLRSERRLRAIASHEPFEPKAVERSSGKLQVDLLPMAPGAGARKRVLAMAADDDLLAIRGTELYWLPSGGTLESDLDLAAIDDLVGPGTRRTKGTIEQMAAKLFGG
jgi:uncharacterized protein (DUF1697 family)